MISYDAIQDVLTAVLVAIVVGVVVAVAWLSTYVREQPLVAFVVIHSSNNGEREQSGTRESETSAAETEPTSTRETNEWSVPTMEATSIKQTIPDSNSEANEDPGGMEVKPITNEEKVGEIHSKENCDTNLNIERVSDISLKELNVNSEQPSLPSPEPSKGEDGVTNIIKEGVGEDTRDTNNASLPSQPSGERPKDSSTISETELRKRRLQQFISMGDTSNTEHLQRLTEQLTASLPSETTGQPDSSESNTIYNEGSKIEKVSISECKETEAPPSTSSLPQEGTSVKAEEIDPRPPGSIKIRLKFLDETQKHVFAQLTEQVGTFKRQHFSIEMDANRRIRLIFNGQLLSQDTSTLAQYGLFDNCVVHCHVSQPQQTTNTAHNREAAAHDEEDAYVSRLLAPLLYGVLAVMWYLRYEYGHLFNAMSTLILLFLTALLLVSTYLLYVSTPATTSTPTATLSHPRTS